MRVFWIGLICLCSLFPMTSAVISAQDKEPDYAFFENLKAPFKPHLTFVAEGQENLCKAFEYQMNVEYFKGYSDEVPDNILGNLKPVEIEDYFDFKLSRYSKYSRRDKIYRFDFNGDGRSDDIYVYYRCCQSSIPTYIFSQISDEFRQNVAVSIETFEEKDEKRAPEDDEIPYGRATREEFIYSNKADSTLAFWNNQHKVVELQGRAYVRSTNRSTKQQSLSGFGSEFQPEKMCTVDNVPTAETQQYILQINIDESFPNFAKLLSARDRKIGFRNLCVGGGSAPNPYYYLSRAAVETRSSIFLRPWFSSEKILDYVETRKSEPWNNQYIYTWSLLNPVNRESYEDSFSLVDNAADELTEYLITNFAAPGHRLKRWIKANLYSYAFWGAYGGRYSSADKRNIDIIRRLAKGGAGMKDFLITAGRMAMEAGYWGGFRQGAFKRQSPKFPSLALLLAVGARADFQVLDELIEAGADIDDNFDDTPLMNAVDHLPMLEFLIEKGADPNVRNGFGKTALMMAAHMNEKQAVKALLKAGADPNMHTFSEFDDKDMQCRYGQLRYRNRTALMYAAENASPEIFDMLVAAGADLGAVDSQGRTIDDYKKLNRRR